MAISSKSFLSTPVLVVLVSILAAASAGIFFYVSSQRTCPARAENITVQVNVEQVQPANEHRIEAQAPGFLGIEIVTVDARTVHRSGVVTVVPGVLVKRALPDFNAYTAGFNRNDIITHVGGQRITDSIQLKRRISSTSPGTRVPVTVLRDGHRLVLYPTVGAQPRALTQAEMKLKECPRKYRHGQR